MAVLFNAGAQVPEMPLLEVVGNAATVAPEQIGAKELNKGVIGVFTATTVDAVSKHPLLSVTTTVYIPLDAAPILVTIGLLEVLEKLLGPVHIHETPWSTDKTKFSPSHNGLFEEANGFKLQFEQFTEAPSISI
ncbi:MAG: hypothetical protein O9326_08515 [Microcystis sp. LE19-338.1B]|nr:hypothetical protein [Microcystis sp. LE19-338.1B]